MTSRKLGSFLRLESLSNFNFKNEFMSLLYSIQVYFFLICSARWISLVRMGPTRQIMWCRHSKEKHNVRSLTSASTQSWKRWWPSSLLAFMPKQQIQRSGRPTGIGQTIRRLHEWLRYHSRLPILDLQQDRGEVLLFQDFQSFWRHFWTRLCWGKQRL